MDYQAEQNITEELAPQAKNLVCKACRDGEGLDFDFQMAFQPIVDLGSRSIFAFEALVRGMKGEGAGVILDRVTKDNMYAFDQAARVKAIETAASSGLEKHGALLSINFMPNAVYNPKTCIQRTLRAARDTGFPTDRIMFEVTESEEVRNIKRLDKIVSEYNRQGFVTAIDDFGAGYAGLGLLADFQPDVIKLDMGLVRGIDHHWPRQAIVSGMMTTTSALGIQVIAEGVETENEVRTLRRLGVNLMQGYYFAKPEIGRLPYVDNL